MQILPLIYLDILDDVAIGRHTCSDRIWLPRAAFERWLNPEAGTVTLVQLQNRVGQSVLGCVFGVHHGDEETIYAPKWMCEALDFDTDHIELTRATPSLCTGLVLQPHTSDHIRAADPQEFLRDGFEQYSVLYPGQNIDLWIDERVVTCTIISLQPVNEPLAIRNCEMVLELLPPLDVPSNLRYKHTPKGCADLRFEGNAAVFRSEAHPKGCAYISKTAVPIPAPPAPAAATATEPIVNKIINAAATFVNEVATAIANEVVTPVTESEPETIRRQKMAAAARKRLHGS